MAPLAGLFALLVGRELVGALQERVFWRTRLAINFGYRKPPSIDCIRCRCPITRIGAWAPR